LLNPKPRNSYQKEPILILKASKSGLKVSNSYEKASALGLKALNSSEKALALILKVSNSYGKASALILKASNFYGKKSALGLKASNSSEKASTPSVKVGTTRCIILEILKSGASGFRQSEFAPMVAQPCPVPFSQELGRQKFAKRSRNFYIFAKKKAFFQRFF
jgi:hypothetical protein